MTQGQEGPKEMVVYTAGVSTWFDLRRELPKQILSLSSLALGGVLTIAEKGKENGGRLLVIAGLAFTVSIALSLLEMHLDSRLVQRGLLTGKKEKNERLDAVITWCSRIAPFSAVIGAVCAGFFVVQVNNLWR